MRKAKLQLSGIGTRSQAFARRLADAKVFLPDSRGVPLVSEALTNLTISFVGVKQTDKLQLEDIATLALVIRAVAQAQRTVCIELPKPYRGEPSRIYRFLERLGFWDLFVQRESNNTWSKNVTLIGHDQRFERFPTDEAVAHYVPLRWFSKKDFSKTNGQNISDDENIWHIRPTVAPEMERQFRSILQTNGIVDAETIDLLSKTMFVELGWNAVLHSGATPGAAQGVFCAQINYWHDQQKRPLPPTLTFCIADIGCGIPNALRSSYRAETNTAGRYHVNEGCNENTGIVRYALDPDSTSRPELPPGYGGEGFRGLAFVASALRSVGDMHIRSYGGAVTLSGHVEGTKATLSDAFEDAKIIGTQVIGHLRIKVRAAPAPLQDLKRTALGPLSVHLVCDFTGECPALTTSESAAHFATQVRSTANTLILDVGYADDGARSIEYLCKHIVQKYSDRLCVFWHIRTAWSQLAGLDSWLQIQCDQGSLPPLFVRSHQDARVLGAARWVPETSKRKEPASQQWLRTLLEATDASANDSLVGVPVYLTTPEFVRLTNEINSNYLARGFETQALLREETNNSASGFFTGNIHLLKGGAPVARYFSLTKNVTCVRDANLRRWVEGF